MYIAYRCPLPPPTRALPPQSSVIVGCIYMHAYQTLGQSFISPMSPSPPRCCYLTFCLFHGDYLRTTLVASTSSHHSPSPTPHPRVLSLPRGPRLSLGTHLPGTPGSPGGHTAPLEPPVRLGGTPWDSRFDLGSPYIHLAKA